jgi:hypothetical protein
MSAENVWIVCSRVEEGLVLRVVYNPHCHSASSHLNYSCRFSRCYHCPMSCRCFNSTVRNCFSCHSLYHSHLVSISLFMFLLLYTFLSLFLISVIVRVLISVSCSYCEVYSQRCLLFSLLFRFCARLFYPYLNRSCYLFLSFCCALSYCQ